MQLVIYSPRQNDGILKVEESSVTWQLRKETHASLSSHPCQEIIIELEGRGDPGENFHASVLLIKSLLIEFTC